jgi:GntR family transcriptional regulator / MocR family aminotransferase
MLVDEASWWALEPRPRETLRAALERTLRGQIVSGALRGGTKLPSSRALARTLGVSRGVVTDAYAQLEAQGLLLVEDRRAPTVAPTARSPAKRLSKTVIADRVRYDLLPTGPDVTLFPLNRWGTSLERVIRAHGPAVLDYRDPAGELSLRETLADHLGRTRGVIAEPEQIIVVQGTAQAIDLMLRVLQRRGASSVAVEDPSHSTQRERVRASSLTLRAQSVDVQGLITEGLDADAVIVTPAHQYPTGVVLASHRRRALVDWAKATGGIIIEDDYDAEFRYDREPVRALQGLAPDRVAQIGTVSKTLAPAFRLGWIVAPESWADELAAERRLIDDFSPVLDQLALREFIQSGDYHRHVRRARAAYRRRRDKLIAEFERILPDCDITGIAAGVHVVVEFGSDIDDAQIAKRALVAGIKVAPLSDFCVEAPLRGLVVGYGRVHESAIAYAARALGKIVQDVLATPKAA